MQGEGRETIGFTVCHSGTSQSRWVLTASCAPDTVAQCQRSTVACSWPPPWEASTVISLVLERRGPRWERWWNWSQSAPRISSWCSHPGDWLKHQPSWHHYRVDRAKEDWTNGQAWVTENVCSFPVDHRSFIFLHSFLENPLLTATHPVQNLEILTEKRILGPSGKRFGYNILFPLWCIP